ncbi:MAG: SNF2-related protein, partial [bacterium]|nr:SNF2-related protein [bacterium]
MPLYPHQREACRRILSHYAAGGDGFLLADAPGVGKTHVAVAVAEALGGSATVLSPATLVTMWREMLPRAQVYSYEYYRRNRPALCDFVILDEAHRVKNARAQVSTALREALRGRRRLLLTGTPFQLGPAELAHLVYLAGGEHRRILDFGRQVETFWGKKWIWAAPPATVGEWLRAQPWWLRRELSSVAQYLPPMAQRWHTLPDSATYSTAARHVAEELERAAAEDPRHAETLRALACGLLPEGDVDMSALMQRLS